MPKKMGVNSKAEEARARKNNAETEKKDREARQKEDQYWKEAEGAKSRAAKKKEEESAKRAEAAAKKAEIRRLQEQEEKNWRSLVRKWIKRQIGSQSLFQKLQKQSSLDKGKRKRGGLRPMPRS